MLLIDTTKSFTSKSWGKISDAISFKSSNFGIDLISRAESKENGKKNVWVGPAGPPSKDYGSAGSVFNDWLEIEVMVIEVSAYMSFKHVDCRTAISIYKLRNNISKPIVSGADEDKARELAKRSPFVK